jgi:prepilin peptidase CpaA
MTSSSAEITHWVVAVLLTPVLAWAAVSDVRHRRIPNWTVLTVIALFIPWAVASTLPWSLAALAAGVIALAATFALYAAGVFGAGDSKLFAAVALLTGLGHLALLALATALVGAVVAVISIASRPTRALAMFNLRGNGEFGRGIPYGVAIAAAAAALVWADLLKVPLPALLPHR